LFALADIDLPGNNPESSASETEPMKNTYQLLLLLVTALGTNIAIAGNFEC